MNGTSKKQGNWGYNPYKWSYGPYAHISDAQCKVYIYLLVLPPKTTYSFVGK